MSFDSMLEHRVSIVRDIATGALDASRHAIVDETVLASDVPAAIQPKTVRELALQSDAGVTVSDHTVYLRPTDLLEADRILHDGHACPFPDASDMPDATYLVRGIRNAAGHGHHLEVDVTAVASRSAGGS